MRDGGLVLDAGQGANFAANIGCLQGHCVRLDPAQSTRIVTDFDAGVPLQGQNSTKLLQNFEASAARSSISVWSVPAVAFTVVGSACAMLA